MAVCMAETWIGSMYTPWAVLIGLGMTLLGLLGWGWQSILRTDVERVETADRIVEAA
jgi:hypothetical protein